MSALRMLFKNKVTSMLAPLSTNILLMFDLLCAPYITTITSMGHRLNAG